MDLYRHNLYERTVFASQTVAIRALPCTPWEPPRSTHQAPPRQPGIFCRWSDCGPYAATNNAICFLTSELHRHHLLSRICLRHICFHYRTISSNPYVVDVVRRPCSDFSMLRRLINCHNFLETPDSYAAPRFASIFIGNAAILTIMELT